jgi:hypothetical protein
MKCGWSADILFGFAGLAGLGGQECLRSRIRLISDGHWSKSPGLAEILLANPAGVR